MINLLNSFLKIFGIYMCSNVIYLKIIDSKKKIIPYILCTNILLSFIITIFQTHIPIILLNLIIFFINSYILSKLSSKNYRFTLVANIIAITFSFIFFGIAGTIFILIWFFTKSFSYKTPMTFLIIFTLQIIFQHLFFRIKRFKHGFSFLNNNYDLVELLLLTLCIVIIIIYFFIGNYTTIQLPHLFYTMLLLSLLMIPIIQKKFILYQKQKLLNKTLKEYETELTETKSKLETALQEKHNLVKSNHEFYHRQEALKQKLNALLQTHQSTYTSETAEEYAQILDRINNLSKEYTDKTKSRVSLPKTNIPELDDMFTYLQSECEKYEIEFILKLNADVNHMIETIIPKNKLETLIGDLVRNAIIAINHSNNEYKSIMVILGIKDNCFEFCVHDSGVEFEISTLLKLGTEPATTHVEDGGTGIGFITTFETLEYCKASLIINENMPQSNNYTKSVVIRFDNSNKYIVNSYRADYICEFNNSRKDISINKIDL